MRTVTVLMLAVLMGISCIGVRQKQPPTIEYPPRDISEIGIKYVDGNLFYDPDVLCEEFETLSGIKHQKITDTVTIAKIMYLIDEAPVDTLTYGIDTRRQLKIHWNNGTTETICLGGPIIQRNDTLYRGSDELVETIELLLPERSRYSWISLSK